ncbi:MAG: PHP domain-containing protein [Clostridia bacterium]|nr:PHP domain-containing protein [Clostridia bacterium]
MYKCDPHVHTKESSICGLLPAAEMARLYKEAGYTTIFITDHFNWYCGEGKPDFTLKEYVEQTSLGYTLAKEEGDKIGLRVLWAPEIKFRESFNHFLVYGIRPEDLWQKEDLFEMTTAEFYLYAKEKGGYVVQGHPFRDEICYPMPHAADAFEVYNSHPRHRNHNEEALAASVEYGKPCTAGSDAHRLGDIGLSGILTDTEIKTVQDYINAVKTQNLELIK